MAQQTNSRDTVVGYVDSSGTVWTDTRARTDGSSPMERVAKLLADTSAGIEELTLTPKPPG